MSNSNLEQVLDRSLIDRKLNALVSRRQREIIMESLSAGATVLRDLTRENLLKKMPKATSAPGKGKRKMVEDVHIVKDKDMDNVIVSIMNFLTKWYEMGTDNRYLRENHQADSKHHRTYKKGESRGQIKPLWFFRETRESRTDEVIEAIESTLTTLLKKEFDETT